VGNDGHGDGGSRRDAARERHVAPGGAAAGVEPDRRAGAAGVGTGARFWRIAGVGGGGTAGVCHPAQRRGCQCGHCRSVGSAANACSDGDASADGGTRCAGRADG